MTARAGALATCLAAAAAVAGCGGSSHQTAGSTPAPRPKVPALQTAPPSDRITVKPLTTKPGGHIRVTVRVHASKVQVTLSGKGGRVTKRAKERKPDRFVARLTVPPKLHGGFWPVVATYSGGGKLSAQVKVVTP